MLRTFNDFILHNPQYKKIANDPYFQRIFEFISELENIADMIENSKRGKPALAGIVERLEVSFPDLLVQQYNPYFIRQCIGRMVKEVLEPFGYIPFSPKRMPSNKSKMFTSAHTYSYSGKAEINLVKEWKVEKVKNDLQNTD